MTSNQPVDVYKETALTDEQKKEQEQICLSRLLDNAICIIRRYYRDNLDEKFNKDDVVNSHENDDKKTCKIIRNVISYFKKSSNYIKYNQLKGYLQKVLEMLEKDIRPEREKYHFIADSINRELTHKKQRELLTEQYYIVRDKKGNGLIRMLNQIVEEEYKKGQGLMNLFHKEKDKKLTRERFYCITYARLIDYYEHLEDRKIGPNLDGIPSVSERRAKIHFKKDKNPKLDVKTV